METRYTKQIDALVEVLLDMAKDKKLAGSDRLDAARGLAAFQHTELQIKAHEGLHKLGDKANDVMEQLRDLQDADSRKPWDEPKSRRRKKPNLGFLDNEDEDGDE